MPFEAESISGVICGWTISYSLEPARAAKEMTRVLRPGGYIVIAVQKVDSSFTDYAPGVITGNMRIQTLEQFDELFPDLERVAGFEQDAVGSSNHTIACYQKPFLSQTK